MKINSACKDLALESLLNNLLPITGGRQGSDFPQGLYSTSSSCLL